MIDTSRGINWGAGIFLIGYQIILLLTLPFYFYYAPPSWGLVGFTILLFFITGISITGGYHRYFSHKAFRTNRFVEAILLFFGSMTAQGSALRWCFDHRNHHAYVDTNDDPYSINKGFWYAHFLWILEKPKPIDKKLVPDLLKNPMIVLQDKYYTTSLILTNAIVFLFTGWVFNDYLGAFVFAVFFRLFMLHHFTWFINSLAHTWGDKPFCTEQSAVDNYVISLVTFGEGYHNYHHTYANDYRNGIKWYHFDPTKWTIWALYKLGLASDLKRMDAFTIKKRMVLERKDLLLDKITTLWYVKKEELEKNVQEVSDRILVQIAEFKKLVETYNQVKSTKPEKDLLQKLKADIKRVKKNIKADWKNWQKLSRAILHLRPIALQG
jgi:stearoyl-CoA desaturase (delta-9 desaturase)